MSRRGPSSRWERLEHSVPLEQRGDVRQRVLELRGSRFTSAVDVAERIDFTRVAQAARLVFLMTHDLAGRPQRPAYVAAPMPDMGISAHLATGAEADARDVPPPHGGLKMAGVVAGLPGDKAGLRPGDLIVEFANQQFRRDEGLAALMAMHREVLEGKHGFTLPLKVVRGKTRRDLVMNLR